MNTGNNQKLANSKAKQIGLWLPPDLLEWYVALPFGNRRASIIEAIRVGKDSADTGLNLDGLAMYLDDTNDAVEGFNRRQNIYDLALLHLQTRIEALEKKSANPPE
jgi:hypothetical protein